MKRIAWYAVPVGLSLLLFGCGDDTARVQVSDGSVDGDGGGGSDVCSAFITTPIDQTVLTAENDKDGDACVNGFQTDVVVQVLGARDGSVATLLADGLEVGQSVVSGGQVVFSTVTLATQGTVALSAQIASGVGCVAPATVSVNCNTPTCQLTKPILSAARPKLNGVPAAEGGDRVSSPGSDYQAAFEVATNIEDGRLVDLEVSRPELPAVKTVLTTLAVAGKAVFPGVTLRPDGDFVVEAICASAADVAGRSARVTIAVDTVSPDLTVVEPVEEQHYGPDDLSEDDKFKVCASTTAEDAADLVDARENMGRNLCVAIGSSSAECVPVVKGNAPAGTGCVELPCPGGAPFNVRVTLKDEAGNKVERTVQAVSCASSLPSVQIVVPAGDDPPFNDVSKRLLAATADQAFKDLNPNLGGAQTNVVACTDKADAKARLLVGRQGGTLNATGAEVTVVPAQPGDGCPAGLGFVAKWDGATLVDSTFNTAGVLVTPTELRVVVTDVSTAEGTSPPTRLVVDANAPELDAFQPKPLCGETINQATDALVALTLFSTTADVVMTVTASDDTSVSYTPVMFGSNLANMGIVLFKAGDNAVTVVAQDWSGNRTEFPSPCVLRVGLTPIVSFLSPATGQSLCANGTTSAGCIADADPTTPGWQGDLRVGVAALGGPATSGTVTFSVGGVELGTANIDGTGEATLTGVTIPDGAAVAVFAETSDILGAGALGRRTLILAVDTVLPDAPASFQAAVLNRRETSFRLNWTAPADGASGAVAGYTIKVSHDEITAQNFDQVTETVPFTGVPAQPGQTETIDVGNRMIEKDHYFAVAGLDAAGNRSVVEAFGPIKATMNRKILSPSPGGSNERFGYTIDAVSDLNGDGRSDLLVGSFTAQTAHVFFGREDFSTAGTPDIVFNGPNEHFGRGFAVVGDIDADGLADIAISAPRINTIYIFKGRTNWNASYETGEADYVIPLATIDPAFLGSTAGSSIARLGDFNGDGVDDFAIGASLFNGARGRVTIVLGKANFSSASLNLIHIDGDPAFSISGFGIRVVGMGRFYTSPGGSTLAVSGTVANGTGRIYTFQGPGNGSLYTATSARHSVDGPAANSLYGATMNVLGPIGGSLGLAVASRDLKLVDLHFGSSALGPFAGQTVRLTNSAATGQFEGFSTVIFGGAFSGTSVTASLIGDATPDVGAIASREAGAASTVYIIDGERVRGLGGSADVVSEADVSLKLPEDWGSVATMPTALVRDINGDGFADLAVGETGNNIDGRVIVFW